jgi:trk system potassium uptake protein TrkH
MTWTDAFMHMCSTMGLGGFSSHDDSFGFFDSPRLEMVAVVFMLLAGFNFSMHFLAWRKRSLWVYWRDIEGKTYVGVVLGAVLLIAGYLLWQGQYPDFPTSLRFSLFNVVSIATTTGYANTDFGKWPLMAPILMLFLCGFSTCAGSTGGGIKMIRAIILLKQAAREFVRILHPRVINPVRVGEQVIENHVIFAVLAYMLIYGGTIIVSTFLLLLTDVDVVTAFTAVVACINNMGPGLNQVGPATTYQGLNDFATMVCTFVMLVGRLELMSVFVLFTPAFWRK